MSELYLGEDENSWEDNKSIKEEKINEPSLVVSVKDLKIILDRMGKQYMTDEAYEVIGRLNTQIKNIKHHQ